MIIGDYHYEGKGHFTRIIRQINEGEHYNSDCPVLESQDEIQDWLQWKTIDKFWEKVW